MAYKSGGDTRAKAGSTKSGSKSNSGSGGKGDAGGSKGSKGGTDEASMQAQQDASQARKVGDDTNGGKTVGSNSFSSGTDEGGAQHVRNDQTPSNGGVGTGGDNSGTPQRQKAWQDAVTDYNDTGNSTWDDFWNGVASFAGLREQNPSLSNETDPTKGPLSTGNADWGADTADILGGLAGAAFPGLGIVTGKLASLLNDELGNPIPDVNLGQLGSTPTPDSLQGSGKVAGDVSGGSTDTASASDPTSSGPDRTGASDVAGNIEDASGTGQKAPVVTKAKPDVAQDAQQDTILPTSGIGISIPTQTSGQGSSSINVGTPDQRRRRGTLGGLGRSGLAL